MTSKKPTTASPTAVSTIHSPATASITIIKKEPLDVTAAAIINTLACMEKQMEAVLSAGSSTQACISWPPNDGCHFCGKTGYTMVRSNCAKLESFISQVKICQNHKGKVVLLSDAMIPNYVGKWLYMQRVDKWHRLNLN